MLSKHDSIQRDQLKKEASEVFKREIAVAKTNLEFQL